ncbi:TrkH family potassium uptake protein [Parasulfuritortus cantonensis]|uniref:Trk system potassium uptake protein n=1 Tax=Parasulfuritortus cantonensis TaxID=2528202 RepID=A0A4R1B8G4_9PROT|nr:potassium transporter TrkG [Parasulfuritortus cantonensis]TCJ12925.1 TrkH family potassium uptake protein [Parasulfuritortus cantonensis]
MRRRILPILHVLGLVIAGFGLSMLLPLAISLFFGDQAQSAFYRVFLLTFGSGVAVWLLGLPFRRELKLRDGFLLVVMIWLLLPVFGAQPLMFYMPDLSFTDAYFEAMSGLTATGATVLSGLDGLPSSINLWRTQMHFIGGMGVIVLVVAVLPMLGVGGRQMFKAETPTPMKDTKLTPRMTETAKGLWLAYMFLTTACILSLRAGGMTWMDALIHAFSIMGLGGFSSHDASLGYFNSPTLEAITGGFALLAGINFATHFMALRHFSLNPYRYDSEIRWFLSVVLLSSLGLALFLWFKDFYLDFPEALRYAAFNTISVATTLGFATDDYNTWPLFAGMWMLFLATFSTSAGSTGGGIKMMRAILLYKQVHRELIKLLHPNAQTPTKLGGAVVPNKIIYAVLAFLFIYVAAIVVLSFALIASGLDVFTAFSAVIATLNNTGPGLGQVGPSSTYAVLTDFQTWVCSFSMLLGRLELFTLLVVLTPGFWKK